MIAFKLSVEREGHTIGPGCNLAPPICHYHALKGCLDCRLDEPEWWESGAGGVDQSCLRTCH